MQEQQKQLAAITAELKASKSQVDQQQRELDKANRSAQHCGPQHGTAQVDSCLLRGTIALVRCSGYDCS